MNNYYSPQISIELTGYLP